ncbi:hypothetical protein K6U70_09110 [Vibrio vulnificus]|uniref:hypothetical protein n=1 Tax=Vibrio vulnificus TaxID=672 RepID=UPI001EEADF32|nr:hypothetical protein [Vibrio vulnificus]MCG6272323.1 hypothetical protein [Vibrio vulnificus]
MSENNPSSEDLDRHWGLLWNARLGIRYHMHLHAAYSRMGKFITAFTLLMSTAAFTAVYQSEGVPPELAKWLVCIAALLQIIELVVDTKAKAILHSTLRQKYLHFELSLLGRQYILESEEKEFNQERVSIEVEEPPINRALLDFCHNELVNIYYAPESRKEHLVSLSPFAKMRFFTLT